MRRLHRTGIVLVFALAAAWACGDGYTEGPPADGKDSGASDVVVKDTGPAVLEASVIDPSLMLGTTEPIPRGESGSLPITIVRGVHTGSLSLAVSGLPANVSAPSLTIAQGTSTASLTLLVSEKAGEGAVSIDVALLDGNEKIATASTIINVAPFRSGTLDPDFGAKGFVDLDVPQTLLAFAGDGALYVNTTMGLARWSKEGVRDTTYGPLAQNPKHTFWHMAVTDNGQVYFSGYESAVGSAAPMVVRTTTDGKLYDGMFGTGGTAIVKTAPGTKYGNAIAVAVLPTSIYAVVKPEDDGTGQPGPLTVARMTSIGTADVTYGSGGFRTLPGDIKADESVLISAVGADQYYLVAPHLTAGAPSSFLVEGQIGANKQTFLGDGFATALAFNANGPFLARTVDGGGNGLVRIEDGGIDPGFGGTGGVDAGGLVKALSIDKEGRALASSCRNGVGAWTRYLPDGGADPTYRNGSTTELTCVLAMETTEKYVYLAGTGGSLHRLRMARLLR